VPRARVVDPCSESVAVERETAAKIVAKRRYGGFWRSLRRSLRRWLYYGVLGMSAVAALFGVPIIIDPPPRDRVEESQDAEGRGPGRRRRRPRRR